MPQLLPSGAEEPKPINFLVTARTHCDARTSPDTTRRDDFLMSSGLAQGLSRSDDDWQTSSFRSMRQVNSHICQDGWPQGACKVVLAVLA